MKCGGNMDLQKGTNKEGSRQRLQRGGIETQEEEMICVDMYLDC